MKSAMLFGLFLSASVALGQTTFQEQAYRLMSINAFLQDLRPGTAPTAVTRNRFEAAFELYPQPSLDTRIGRKDEPIDPPEVVPRLRLRYLMRSGLFFGGTAVPGIEFEGYDADTYAIEVGIRFAVAAFDWQVRASGGDGDILGPITETDGDDDFSFTNTAADLSVSRSFGNLSVYGFGGVIRAETELEVAADGAFLEHDESTHYAGLGLTYRWWRLDLNLEQNFTDDYLASVVVSAAYRF